MKEIKNLIYMCLVAIFFGSCTLLVDTGRPNTSCGIEEAKSLGSFIAEYEISDKLLVNGPIKLELVEAWTEYFWYHENQLRQINVSKDSVLVINVKINNPEYFSSGTNNVEYKADKLLGMGYTSSCGHKLILEFKEYRDSIDILFWEKKNVLLRVK